MRSAETSGVEGKRFDSSQHLRLGDLVEALFSPLRRIAAEISPVSLAIALTALTAAALSVAADAARVLGEAPSQAVGPSAEWALAGEAMVSWVDAAQADRRLDGVWQRGGIAFGTAALAIGLTFRRRRRGVGAAARREAGHVEDLLETMPFGVACWTSDGRLMACNDEYRAQLDAGGAETRRGAPYHASVSSLVRGGSMRSLCESDSNRLLELCRDDGSALLIDERPLPGGGFITLLTDVTEQRRTDALLTSIRQEQKQLARRYQEEKLRAEAASRSKTNFLAHLSHDIRTPLNHIIGFADMMRQQTYGPLGNTRYLAYVEAMKDSGERLLGFFASILELAELEGGQKALQQEAFPVDDLQAAVVRRFAAQAKRARLDLIAGAPCGAMLLGDRFSLERMAGNLVENAIRFTPAGGKVTVSAFAAEDGVVLEITDTGIGMSAERLETLSQPFVLSDAAFAAEHGGAGLGIAIARAIAELSGGQLAIDSRPALGTTVAISLPLAEAETTAKAA